MSEFISLDPTVEDLMEALLACDRKTQHFIQPMLGIPAVQHTLLVFLRDGQKTLQEWIWDPRAHSHLSRLREIAETQPAENCAGLSQQFYEALGAATVSRTLGGDAVVKVAEQGGAGGAQSGAENGNGATAEDVEQDIELLVVTAEAANQRAKALFKSKDYRGALAGFLAAARPLEPVQAGSDARKRARATAATCLCNAAVAAAKAGRASDAADAATRALRMSDGQCVKALYWRARAWEEQDMYESALRDVEAALQLDKGVPDVRALHTRLALRVQCTQDLQLADAIWAGKQAEAEAEEEARLLREREAWEPPKPPALVRPEGDKKTASMLLNEYTMRNKFAVDMQVEELIGDGLFRVSMSLPGGCGVRVCATERSQKGARQTAAAALLRGAAERWNLKHPEDPIDMALMELPATAADAAAAPGQPPPSTKELVPPTEEFAQWASSWLALLTDNSAEGRARRVLPSGALHRLLFPACLDSQQRLYVHKQCDGRLSGKFNLGIASKSVGTEKKGRKAMVSRTSVPRRTLLEVAVPAPMAPPDAVDLAAVAAPIPPDESVQ